MAYEPTTWVNGSTPALDADNLNNIETGIADIDTELGTDPAGEYATVAAYLSSLEARMTTSEARILALEGTPPLYGPGVSMDALGNLWVGGSESADAAFRFKAEQSSTLESVKLMWVGGGAYGQGTGGTVRITLQSDDGTGKPSGSAISTVDWVPGSATPSDYVTHSFSSPPTLTAGILYHLCFENIDASPTVNFVSIECVWTVDGGLLSPVQPKWRDDSFRSLLTSVGGPWTLSGEMSGFGDNEYTPIMDIAYGNGEHQGLSYTGVGSYTYRPVIADTTSMARERFTVSGGYRTVSGVGLRLAHTSGTGDLLIRLEDSSGTEIETVNVPVASLPTLTRTSSVESGAWVTVDFTSPHVLASGSEYRLRLATEASTSLWAAVMVHSAVMDGDDATWFPDGFVEQTTNSGSTWDQVYNYGSLADLQFYFIGA